MKTVEQPIVTTRRHYYEDWLARAGGNPESQEDAPHAPERNLLEYKPKAAFHCYALSGDHATKGNLGWYFTTKGKAYSSNW